MAHWTCSKTLWCTPSTFSGRCSSSIPLMATICSAVFHFPKLFTFTACTGGAPGRC